MSQNPDVHKPVSPQAEKAREALPVVDNKVDIEQPCTSCDCETFQTETYRGHWTRKLDFLLSCLSFAVGLGNVWRFPYLCYRNGGGAFLIPFLVMLIICGIPLVFLELAFGQFSNSGVVSSWKICPLFQGIGWGMFIVSILISIYYNMIIAWTIFYLCASFTSTLPWSECGDWSSDNCWTKTKCASLNGTWTNSTCVKSADMNRDAIEKLRLFPSNERRLQFPSADYFHRVVLDISPSIGTMGFIRWQLALCLLLAWILVCVCLAKGIKTSGKVVYFTAIFPYIVLFILLIRSLILPGAADGVIYFLTPTWNKLASAKVWGDAAVQIFFSLSPCWGGLITLASYNQFHNNCLRDAIVVSLLDCATSIFAGLVVFSIIGFMSHEVQQDISQVAVEGAGLAFVVYPEVVTHLPVSPLWSVLFFSMLVSLGLGTQIATVTTVHTTLLDQYPDAFSRDRQTVILLVIAGICYIIGLSFCTQVFFCAMLITYLILKFYFFIGATLSCMNTLRLHMNIDKGGMYLLQLFDNFAASYSLLVIGFAECVAISWFYGADKFLDDISLMLGRRPHSIWKYLWKYVSPATLLAIMFFSWIDFQRTSYNGQLFPLWADGIGWIITCTSILAIPAVAIYHVVSRKMRLALPWRTILAMSIRPKPSWHPRNTMLSPVKDDTLPLEAFPADLYREEKT